jgi:hypothetical protein
LPTASTDRSHLPNLVANNGQGKQPPGARTYAFLIFREEASVQRLISKCFPKGDSYYTVIKSKTVPEKIVQVRPWRLTDSDYMSRPNNFLNPRNTVVSKRFKNK